MKKQIINRMKMEIDAHSANESFARTTVAAFAAQLDPTLEEINDLKTAISEAVTNCVVHAETKRLMIECELWRDAKTRGISVTVTDFGIGIANIEKALEPFFTTKPDQERSGMGFTVMQSFMTDVSVRSQCVGHIERRKREDIDNPEFGTVVEMSKVFG